MTPTELGNRPAFRVGTSRGMSGYYAVVYNTETFEPEYTGSGRYGTQAEAYAEAVIIGQCEGLQVEPMKNPDEAKQ